MFFVPDFNGGGAERALCNLLREWPADRQATWRPTVVVRNTGGPLREHVPEWIEVCSLNLPSSGAVTSIRSAARLACLVRRRRPRVVVSFLSFPLVALSTRVGSPASSVVVSVQNPFAASKVGFTPGRSRSPLTWLACRSATPLVDRFWAISPGIAEEYRALFGIPAARVAVLPNSVDLIAVQRLKDLPVDCPAFDDPGVPVVVTAGRLVHQKRVDILLKAVVNVLPDRPLNLVVLGEGPMRANLERLASGLDIRGRVFFLGFQSNPWRFISKATVFALASDFEGFGNVLLEAMACGVPVVSTRAPFGPEYILSEGKCGRLVPRGDPGALAEGIRAVLADTHLRRAYVEEGLARARDFDIRKLSARFWGLLEEAANRKQDTRSPEQNAGVDHAGLPPVGAER
jgi:glycosyltransferase involved in cell wall biosynthesis